jgi:ATP-binding cassette subfamily B protein AbcA/BmrA
MKKSDKQAQSWKPFLSLLKQARVPWKMYILSLVLSLLISTATAQLPYVAGQIMAGEIFDKGLIGTYVAVTIVLTLVGMSLSLFDTWIGLYTDRNFKRVVWRKLIHIPLAETDKVKPSSLISRITNDTSDISYAISYIFSTTTMVYSMIITLIMVGKININMLRLMMVLIPWIFITMIPSRFMYCAQESIQTALSRYTNFLNEKLPSLKLIKSSNAEGKENVANDYEIEQYYQANIRMAKIKFLAAPLINSIDAIVQAIVLIYGGYLLKTGEIDSASIVSIFMYATTISIGSSQFTFLQQSFKKAQGATSTVCKMIDSEPEKLERKKSFAIPDAAICFEDVFFSYGGGKNAIKNLNFEIPKGKVTAIVGFSGSGKSTVLKLLERLYEPMSGQIKFGNINADEIHLDEWRASFGMVPQNSPLLLGTIKDNIVYGLAGEVSEDEISLAVKKANVQEIIEKLPNGLLSDIGDIGSRLSTGERQRIAIARMMIRDPEYLLTDEATSNLDAENEYQVNMALQKLMDGRTSVIVAHNLSTIKTSDNIVFMDKGTVVANGTHEQLYEQNQDYRRFVNLQRE